MRLPATGLESRETRAVAAATVSGDAGRVGRRIATPQTVGMGRREPTSREPPVDTGQPAQRLWTAPKQSAAGDHDPDRPWTDVRPDHRADL